MTALARPLLPHRETPLCAVPTLRHSARWLLLLER